MNKKRIIIGITVAALLIIGIYFFFWRENSKGGMTLEIAKVTRNSISTIVTATGTVQPITEVEVGTQVSGIIDKIYVDFNSQVKKGQLLAEMDKVTLQSALASQEAILASSKTEFEYQQKNYFRSKTLYEKKLISDTDYETATYNYQKAKNAYEGNVADLVKVKRNLGYATITSPIDGVVIYRAVEEGQTVASGFSTPKLFTIVNDLTKMEVIANVDEADIGQIQDGQRVSFTVDAYPNDEFEGQVIQVRLQPTTTSNVVTYEVVINAPNSDLKLKPGLTANITIYTMERTDILTIPSKALRFVPNSTLLKEIGVSVSTEHPKANAGKKLIWLQKDHILQPKLVSVGITNGINTEIKEGVKDGEDVVVGMTSVAIQSTAASTDRSPFMPQRTRSGRGR